MTLLRLKAGEIKDENLGRQTNKTLNTPGTSSARVAANACMAAPVRLINMLLLICRIPDTKQFLGEQQQPGAKSSQRLVVAATPSRFALCVGGLNK